MRRRVFALAAALMIMAAFVAGYMLNLAVAQPGAAPAAASASVPASTVSTAPAITATEQAYRVAAQSVVFVNAGTGTGSGIVYDNKGDIVTNNHVVSGHTSLSVTFNNGKTVSATVVGTDSADDLAVIHVNTSGLTAATFAKAGSYQVAEDVLAVGSPLGLKQSVTSGLISGINRTQQEPSGAYIANAIQTSAPINPGNSGGALVDLNGVVVGIPTLVQTTTSGSEPVQNVGFAIPSERVTLIANQIISNRHVLHTNRPYLGVGVADASAQSQYSPYGNGGPTVNGAAVNAVSSSSPAGRLGIQQGDVITKFNGYPINSANDLLSALAQLRPGASVSITWNSNGSNHTAQITLGELPANG
jgi:putative serine protease PepD